MLISRLKTIFAVLVCTTLPFTAFAADLALVITNGNYGSGVATRPVTLRHDGLVTAYQDQGYEVIDGKNLAGDEMRDLLASFIARA
jgi:hypothetical protein